MSTDSPVVALIGAGGIARMHAQGWVELGAQMRVYSPSSAVRLASEFPNTAPFSSVAQAMMGADVVDVCTPTDIHESVAIQALESGLDVICEKPLGRTAAQARAIVAAADRAGRKLLPAHVVRWFHEYEAAHATISAGDLGIVDELHFTRTGRRPEPAWFHDLDRSGGMVLDLMIHDLDQALWLGGDVVEVTGQTAPVALDFSESAQVHLRHAGGARSTIDATWGPPSTRFRTTFTITGSEGVLDHDSRAHRQGRMDERSARTQARHSPHVVSTSPYHQMLADFLAWHRGGPTPPITPVDGVRAVVLAEAALAAVQTGDTITLAPSLDGASQPR